MEAMTKQILTDTAVGTAVGGASGALIGAGIGIVGSGALAQGQTLAARYTTAKDHQAHLGGGLAYNILHKYKWLSGAAKLEDRYDAKNEAVARSEYASTAASYQGLTKYPLFDAWGGLCLGGSEIMDAGSNFASLMSFAAELVAVELILAAFVSMGVTLPAAAAIKETGTMIGLVSDGLGVEAEMAKMEYLSYRAAKAGPGESPEKNEIIAQMAETNTDILGTTVKSIIDVFSVIGIPKTLNFGKLKKSAAAIGQMPGWIRKAESFAARAVGPLLKFAGRIKPWVLTAKKLLMGAYTIKKWVARVLGAYGDAKKFLQNSGKLAKRVGHAAGLVYQGAKSLGSSVVASVKEHGSQALDFLKGKFSAVKSAGLDAKNYAVGKIHAAENWAGSKANDASQWMLKNREWLGETLHQASDVFGVLSAATGVVATGLALTGIGLPFAAGVGMASLAFGAAAAASRAWYSTMLAVGTIDGSVPVSDARGEMWGAVRDTALVGFGSYAGKARTLGDGALSMARGESAASTAKVTGTKVADEIVTRKTLGSLNKVMLTLKKFYNLPLGKVLKDAALAKRLKWLTIALRATDFVKSVIDLVTSPLAAVGKSIVSGAKFVGHQIGKAESWLGHRAEAGAALIGRKGRSFALAAVHAGRSAFHKIGRGGLNLLQNAGRGLKSAGHSVAGHLTHLKSQAMELAAKANKWARQGVHQGAAALLTGLASALRQSHALAASAGVLFGRSRGRFMGSVTSGFAAALGHNLLAARSVLGFLEEGGHPSQIGSALHEVTHTLSAVTYGIAGALTSAFAEDLHHAGLPHLPTRLATPSFAGHSFSLGGGFPSFAFSVPQAHSAGGLHPESALKMFGSQERAAAPSVSHFVSGLRARASSAVSGTAHSLPSLLPAAHGLVSAAHAAPAQVGGLLHRFMPHVPTGRGIPPRQTAGLVRSAAHAAHALLSPGLRMLHARGLRRALPTIPALSAVRHLLPSHLAATLPTIAAHPLTRLHGAEHRAQRAAHQVADHLPKMPVALAHIGHGLSHFFQRSGRGDHPDIDPTALRADLKRQSGGFLPDGNVRAKLGGHLGFDPGGARLHTGPAAAQASRRLNAEAFTIGNDVFFGEGRFDPHTPKGLGLIAHELTHVGQQTGTTGSKARFFSEAGGDQMEREAQHTAEHVLANAGSRSGLFVEDYIREYEGEGGLTQADQQRLDRISVMALAEAQRMLASQGMHGSVNSDALDVQVEIDLGEMSDGEAARVWAETILSSMNAVAPAGAQAFELNHQEQAQTGGIQRSKSHSGIPSSGAAKLSVSPPAAVPIPAVQMHDFVFNGKSQLVTEEEYQHLVAEANRRLMIRLGLVESGADFGRKMQDDFMQDTHHGFAGIFGKTSDWMGGVKPPAPAIWEWPKPPIVSGRKALQSQNLTEAAAQFTIANSKLAQAQRLWHDYINGTISGGETGIEIATVVRDTSFSIAVGSAAVLVAPVAIGLAGSATAGVGLTGTAAAIGTGVGATGIVAVGGGIMGASLRGSSEIGGEALANHGHVNWQEVGSNTLDGAKHGAVDAATSLIGMGVGRVGAKFIRPSLESLGARTIRGVATGAVSGGVGGFLNAVVTPPKRRKEDGPESWSGWAKRVGMSTALGVGGGALGSAGNELLAGAAPGTMRRILVAGTSNAISGGGTAAAQEAMDARREHRQFDRNAIYKGAASASFSSGLQAGASGAYRTRTPNGTRSMVSLEAHNNRFDQAFQGGSAAHRAMEPHPVEMAQSSERIELETPSGQQPPSEAPPLKAGVPNEATVGDAVDKINPGKDQASSRREPPLEEGRLPSGDAYPVSGPQGVRHLPRGFRMPTQKTSFASTSEQMGTAEQRTSGMVTGRGQKRIKGSVRSKALRIPGGRFGSRDHWQQHGHEFQEYNNARQYKQGAVDFCREPDTRRFFYKHHGEPRIGYYNEETNTFASTSIDGATIFTYFRPKDVVAEVTKMRMPENSEGRKRKYAPGMKGRHSVPTRHDEQ